MAHTRHLVLLSQSVGPSSWYHILLDTGILFIFFKYAEKLGLSSFTTTFILFP